MLTPALATSVCGRRPQGRERTGSLERAEGPVVVTVAAEAGKGAGLATKGSQRQLQLYANAPDLRAALERRICDAAPTIASGSFWWRSPVVSDAYREYFDGGFLSAIGQPDLKEELARFWPRRGPVWDGLATFTTTAGEPGVLLVEAKAHSKELLRGGSIGRNVSADSRATIEDRLSETRSALGPTADAVSWLRDRYQAANRLAHAMWLRQHVPASLLVHLLFYDDPTHIAESEAEVRDASAAVYEALGFEGGAPDFAITVTCRAADPLAIAPREIPAWANEPLELSGLRLTGGEYPPDPALGPSAGAPLWALVGQDGRENDEIAVAAFLPWLELSSLTAWWDGHTPVRAVKPLQRVCWSEFPDDSEAAVAAVHRLAHAVRNRRRQSYRRCADCHELTAPEHRDRIDRRYVCHGCQERYHGVVH